MAEVEEALIALGGFASTPDIRQWLKDKKNHSGHINHCLLRMEKNGIIKRIKELQLHKKGGNPIIYALCVPIEVKNL